MTRLAISTDSFFPREGGAERQLRRVGADLAATHGWDVYVVAHRFDGLAADEVVDGLHVIRVARPPTRAGSLWSTFRAARALRSLRPDVIVAVQSGSSAMSAALAARGQRQLPVVVRLTGGELPTRGARGVMARRALETATAIVAPARHLLAGQSPFADALAHKGTVIPNGVAPTDTPGGQPREVVWIGRADPLKGLPDLVALAKAAPEIAFVAIGPDGADVSTAPNLTCTGWLEDPTPRLANATALVSTSRTEGSPNAALEALAMGVPVVAWDIPGFRELAQRARSGVWLVPFGDVPAMRDVVVDVHRRRTQGETLVIDAEVPVISDVAQEWDRLLRRVIADCSKTASSGRAAAGTR